MDGGETKGLFSGLASDPAVRSWNDIGPVNILEAEKRPGRGHVLPQTGVVTQVVVGGEGSMVETMGPEGGGTSPFKPISGIDGS